MRSRRVTIRAKLYVAILLTVLGPVVTIAVALHGMQRLGDRFDEVQQRADQRALALDLKFGVTDFNGWQTAYGYDDGASRPRFERSVRAVPARPRRRAQRADRPARASPSCDEIGARFDAVHGASTTWRTRRCSAATTQRVKQIFLGPELRLFDAMAQRADELARYEARGATVPPRRRSTTRARTRAAG